MGCGKESLFNWSMSHDQDGRHVRIWKKTLKLFTGTKRSMTLKLGMQHRVLKYYQLCSNDDTGLTLTYFTARSNLALYALYGKKVKQKIFSETSVVYDAKLVDPLNLMIT